MSQFFWRLRISKLFIIDIYDPELYAVFRLDFTKLVQERLPQTVLGKILSHAFGYKNVTRIAAIHYPLGKIDPRSRYA